MNAELSRGAGPLAELMRDVHSHKVSSVKYSNKKGKRKSKIYKLYSEISSIPAQRLQPSSLIRADVSIHDQALHSLLGHKCIDLCTTDVKASERRAAASVLSTVIRLGPPEFPFGGGGTCPVSNIFSES